MPLILILKTLKSSLSSFIITEMAASKPSLNTIASNIPQFLAFFCCTAGNREIEDWFFLHRFRYQFRTQYPFYSKGDKQLYGAAADEIFIGAGKNLGVNIFDQNRIFALLGYKLNKKLSIEAGYMNQTLQQGRRVNNSTIMQRNNGVVVSSFINW